MRRGSYFSLIVAAVVWAVSNMPVAASELRRESVMSTELGREMPFSVYLPPGYQDDAMRYPVLYLLHGAGGDEMAWAEHGLIKQQADRLIASAVIPPTIIVMPGCPSCWWVDGPSARAESAFFKDLIPEVARRFRTIDRREGRILAGLSAGGFATVRYALRYPETFAAAAALSPAVYAETPPAHSAARKQPPFLRNGAFDQTAWDAKNYPRLLPSYLAQKSRIPLYLVSGDSDEFGIAYETALLFKQLFERKCPVELRVVDGDHTWKVWASALDGAMRFMARHAAKPQSLDQIVVATPVSAPIPSLDAPALIATSRR